MSTLERALGGAEIEVAAKATRRRFPLDYKRKIVRVGSARPLLDVGYREGGHEPRTTEGRG